MKKLLLLLLCVPLIGFGQGWIFGDSQYNSGQSVQQTNDGGYIIAGLQKNYSNTTGWSILLLKTDAYGNELWNQNFHLGNASDYLYLSDEYKHHHPQFNVIQTIDDGYILCGTYFSTNSSRLIVIKFDNNGNEQWTQLFDNPSKGHFIQQTNDGGYIITGEVYDNTEKVYLIKIDSNGNEEWSKKISGGGYEQHGYCVRQTTDNGFVISGFITSFGNFDAVVYLTKTDAIGNTQWTKSFGDSTGANGYCVQQTFDGGFVITGRFGYSIDNDVCLIKTDSSGNETWIRTFGGLEDDRGHYVEQTDDGGYIIVGFSDAESLYSGVDSDLYLIKTNSTGNEEWNKKIGGNDADIGYSVQQTNDGGYIICGATYSFGNGNSDVYLIKTDGNGNVTSEFSIPINSNRELEKVVDILGRDINPEKNKPFIEIYNDGTVEKKIIIE